MVMADIQSANCKSRIATTASMTNVFFRTISLDSRVIRRLESRNRMRDYPNSYSGRTGSNVFGVLVQRHTKEVLDLPGARETRPLVEPDCPLEWHGCIEADPSAVVFSEMRFRVCQQSGGNTGALHTGEYRHSANVAFFRRDDTTSNRANNLSGFLRCYEYGHLLKASTECFCGEYGVGKRSGSVAVAIHFECCGEAREDAGRICTRSFPNRHERLH